MTCLDVCAICGRYREVTPKRDTGVLRCSTCRLLPRTRKQPPCSICGTMRTPETMIQGRSWCRPCYASGQNSPDRARAPQPDRAKLPQPEQMCADCGVLGPHFRDGRCPGCRLPWTLRSLLTTHGRSEPEEELLPIVAALSRGDARAIMQWLDDNSSPRHVLRQFAIHGAPITHELIDEIGLTLAPRTSDQLSPLLEFCRPATRTWPDWRDGSKRPQST